MSTKSKKTSKTTGLTKQPPSAAEPTNPAPPATPTPPPTPSAKGAEEALGFDDNDLVSLDLSSGESIKLDIETGEIVDSDVLVPKEAYLTLSAESTTPAIAIAKSTLPAKLNPAALTFSPAIAKNPTPALTETTPPVNTLTSKTVDKPSGGNPAIEETLEEETPALSRKKPKVSALNFLIDARRTHLDNVQVYDPDTVQLPSPYPAPPIQDVLQKRILEEYSRVLTSFWRDGGPTPGWPPYGYMSYSQKTPSACPLFYPKWLAPRERGHSNGRVYSRNHDHRHYDPYRSSRLRPESTLEEDITAAVQRHTKRPRGREEDKFHNEETSRYAPKPRGMPCK